MSEIDEQRHQEWLRTQPWYVRLDEWQHEHGGSGPGWLAMLWHVAWHPLCEMAEHHHRKGTKNIGESR